ncbi:MAG: DUF4920 domain-containing protein [Bacteroidales bacterium]
MLRKSIGILAIIMMIVSCTSQQSDTGQADSGKSIEVNISEILSDPIEYDSKSVQIEGVISHVCRHSGDKMRVMQDDSDLSILVMLGDFTGKLDAESEGQRVVLSGMLMTEVTNLDDLTAHNHDDGEEAHECESTLQAVEAMKAKGLNPDIRTFIALNQYETK